MITLAERPVIVRGCRICGYERVVPNTGLCARHLHGEREKVQLPIAFELKPIVAPDYTAPAKDTHARFLEFHRMNPHVYDHLKDMVRETVQAGTRHASIRMFWENLRYKIIVSRNSEYVANNNYAKYYARLIQDEVWCPANFFEFRSRHANA